MSAEVLSESYVLATGYAALMGASEDIQHLFARRYDFPVTLERLKGDWRLLELELQQKVMHTISEMFERDER